MTGANIFVIYADAAGTNVTLSPRLGAGHKQPDSDTTADVTLLGGSGISSDGTMTANIRCSNCNSWSGGSMSLTDTASNWIWAYKSGDAISSDSVSATITQHSSYGTTTLDLANAVGGSSSNPFLTTTSSSTTSSNSSSSGSSGSTSSNDPPANYNMVRMAHAILAPLAFVLFFPFGAIAIRIFKFRNLVYFHAGWMVLTYILVLASMGMGIWMGRETDQIDTDHAIIGLVVAGCLLIQPISGLTHHLIYKRTMKANAATYPHVWWGRAVITLGIINGGLGLRLSEDTTKGEIAYGVIAGFMWLLWMIVIVIAFLKSRGSADSETGAGVFAMRTPEMKAGSFERMKESGSFQKHSPDTFYEHTRPMNISRFGRN